MLLINLVSIAQTNSNLGSVNRINDTLYIFELSNTTDSTIWILTSRYFSENDTTILVSHEDKNYYFTYTLFDSRIDSPVSSYGVITVEPNESLKCPFVVVGDIETLVFKFMVKKSCMSKNAQRKTKRRGWYSKYKWDVKEFDLKDISLISPKD